MDSKKIMALFKKGSVKRLINKQEAKYLCSLIMLPYDGVKKVVDLINSRMHKIIRVNLKKIKMYECFIPGYLEDLYNTWVISLAEAGIPKGAIASDAIGQQATQALLNTFHQAGSAKSGGPDGIRENISISPNRKILYSVINFRNKKLKIEDVMRMRSKFIGITLNDIAISILPLMIDIEFHRQMPEEYLPRNEKAGSDMVKNGTYWWYTRANFSHVFTGIRRHAIRIELDVMKLYEFQLDTTIISTIINQKPFEFKTKDKSVEFVTIAIPSPTYIGIIDIFLSSKERPLREDVDRDYILQACFGLGDFHSLEISGIQGIKNFYPVTKKVSSIVRDIELSDDKKGTWVYFEDLRYSYVPINRFYDLCKAAELEIDTTEDSEIEYISHKIMKEKRKIVKVKTISYNGVNYNPILELKLDKSINEYKLVESNPFFKITEFTPSELKLPSIYIMKERYDFNLDRCIRFENDEHLKFVITSIMNGDEKICKELIDPSFFVINGEHHPVISFPIEVVSTQKRMFIWACLFYKQTFTLEVDINYINRRENLTTLETAINGRFGLRDFSLPEILRLPKIEHIIDPVEHEKNEDYVPRILIKSTLFFRDEFDKIDKQTGKRIKMDPIDRLKRFLDENCDDEILKTYAYAETQGSSLSNLLANPIIDSRTTYCNDFYQTFEMLGIESLRNLLGYDLISIINSSGDINPKYPVLTSDVTTCNGINPFTSTGSSSQNNGVISTITFDNVKKYITKAAIVGKQEVSTPVSTAIFFGNQLFLGTGYSKIKFDNLALSVTSPTSNSIKTNMKDIIEDEEYEEPRLEPTVSVGKFPKVKWVFNKFIKKDIIFYINMGMIDFFTSVQGDVKPLSLSFVKSKLVKHLKKPLK
jgi:hypothetical protein